MSATGRGYLTAGEEEIEILFTNRALAQAETQLGKTVLQIVSDASGDNLGIGDVTRLLLVGMQAARRDKKERGTPPSMKDAFDVIDQVGFAEVTRVVFEALAAVLSYAPKKGKEPDDDDPKEGKEPDDDPPE